MNDSSPARSADYTKGYVDFWCGLPAYRTTADYIEGYSAGSEAKRILDGQGFATHNESYPELAAPARQVRFIHPGDNHAR